MTVFPEDRCPGVLSCHMSPLRALHEHPAVCSSSFSQTEVDTDHLIAIETHSDQRDVLTAASVECDQIRSAYRTVLFNTIILHFPLANRVSLRQMRRRCTSSMPFDAMRATCLYASITPIQVEVLHIF